MSTRSMQFFMTLDECETVLRDIARELSLHLILGVPGNPERFEIAKDDQHLTLSNGEQPYWVFLAKAPLSPFQKNASHVHPAKWGWVQCVIPREKDNVLYMTDLGCKSDYYEKESKTVHENPLSIEIYTRVVRFFRKKLRFQTYIGPEGGAMKPCSGVKHSQGAVDWVSNGGRLKARGQVAEYGIVPTEDSKK